MAKKAVLLINLGTPDHCEPTSVRRYLREFLMDPRVVDLPGIVRAALVNLLILPFRVKRSTAAYQKIWQAQGSPLLTNTQHLQRTLSEKLGDEYQVEFGMRYGNPSIETALARFKEIESLTMIPLFPQYSSAATGSAIEKFLVLFAKQWNIPDLRIINNFYSHPGFISAYADIIQQHIQEKKIDALLFSYHGLPERHINKSECLAECNKLQMCPTMRDENQYCYRSQCFATSHLIANELQLSADQYQVAFQSRLGRTPWIKPYTDLLLPELIQQGVRHVAVVCPSFVADCLETLEEVDIRTRAQWHALGGKEFTFIPCLNDSSKWADALAMMVRV